MYKWKRNYGKMNTEATVRRWKHSFSVSLVDIRGSGYRQVETKIQIYENVYDQVKS